MASAAPEVAVASLRGSAPAHARGSQDAATAAWVCAIPCAAIAVAAILLLGPPLGRLLFPAHSPYTFLAGSGPPAPEPTKQARYLLALCAPLLGALATASAPRWLGRVAARATVLAVVATQLALVGVVVASIVAQYRLRFGVVYTLGREPTLTLHYFVPATLAVAALLAAATAGALRSERVRQRAGAALLRESRRRRLVVGGLALAATAIWMLHAVHSDAEIGNAVEDVRYHLGFTLDETFAVLNGRTPLVDFTAQYGSLWPFVIAVPMLAAGKTVLTFTIVLCTITAIALLAIYGVLRRVTRSATTALLLYLPFLATSLYQISGTLQNRSTVGSYYANFPLRYAMPFFVAWLTARRIERGRGGATGAWLLFTAAGLALLNNGDFGIAALGATVAALLWSGDGLRRPALLRLAGAVAAGLATALALVSLLTLVRAGALPQPARLVDYARTYAIGGFALMPIPGVLGVHLLIYLTYVAAIVVATVRVLRGARNRVLTGMLAWAGVFGLGAGTYWVGRSHPVALKYQFSAWALALALLAVVAIGELAAPRLRRTAIGALVALFGFGVAACSLAQTPTPWGQIARLQAPFVPTEATPEADPLVPPADAATRRFVASLADGPSRFVVRRGAPVAILLTTGHRVADAYGVVNVSPYTGIESLQTVQRVEAVLDALRDAGGNTVILPNPLDASIFPVLRRRGFELLTQQGLRPYVRGRTRPDERPWPGGTAVIKWVDTRHLHPRALR
ncbi:MAG TPA: hypothetical protein VFF79_09695 [Conexibacter sp.]|jgi:hypothetical protein|nr:hypothetical protein [Conexibacter sp.]